MINIVDEIKRFMCARGNWTGSASELIEQGFNCVAPNRLSRDIGAVTAELNSIGIIVETGKKQGKRFISIKVDDNNPIVQGETDNTTNPIVHDPIVQSNHADSIVHSIVQPSNDSIVHSIVQGETDTLTESNISYNYGGKLTNLVPVPEGLSVNDIFQAPEPIRRRWRCPDRCAELFHGFCGMKGERQEAIYSDCPNHGIPVKGQKIQPVWAILHAVTLQHPEFALAAGD